MEAHVAEKLLRRLLLEDVAEHRPLEVKDVDALKLGRRGREERDLVVVIQAVKARAADLADARTSSSGRCKPRDLKAL